MVKHEGPSRYIFFTLVTISILGILIALPRLSIPFALAYIFLSFISAVASYYA